jgi:hypothetical protein
MLEMVNGGGRVGLFFASRLFGKRPDHTNRLAADSLNVSYLTASFMGRTQLNGGCVKRPRDFWI